MVTCAIDVGGYLPNRMAGDTLTGSDGYDRSSCGIGGGAGVEDAAFLFTAPHAGTYRFTTEGSDIDTILGVRDGTCAARELFCNDDAIEGEKWSALTMTLDECETVTLVVDGADGAAVGPFVLEVGASEASCFDGVDDDADGMTDCEDPDCRGPRCDIISGEWPDDWSALERGLYAAVNEQRERGGACDGEAMPPVRPLARDVLLEEAARRHTLDMAERGFFAHDTPEGLSPGDRTAAVGYESGFVGENIARGSLTVAGVMEQWMNSPGHCRNIMNPSWTEIGVGFASPEGDPHWTQNFGRR